MENNKLIFGCCCWIFLILTVSFLIAWIQRTESKLYTIKNMMEKIRLDQEKTVLVPKAKLNILNQKNYCQWGSWSDWETCSRTCGSNGTKKRQRTLLTLSASGLKVQSLTKLKFDLYALGGGSCQGLENDVQKCNIQPCIKGTYIRNFVPTKMICIKMFLVIILEYSEFSGALFLDSFFSSFRSMFFTGWLLGFSPWKVD